MYDYAASRREVVNLFRGFFRWSYRAWHKLPVSRYEGVFIFLGLSFRGSSFSLQASFAFSLLLTSFQSVFWSSFNFFTLVFARYSPFYFSLFLFSIVFPSLCSTYSSPYQTPFRVFLDSLHVFSVLYLLGRSLSLYFQSIFTRDPFSMNLNCRNFFCLEKLWLWVSLLCKFIRDCKIPRITFQQQTHQYDFPLTGCKFFPCAASHPLTNMKPY